jgi:hypothetical protein
MLRTWLRGLSVGGARCCWIQEPNGASLETQEVGPALFTWSISEGLCKKRPLK